MGATLLDPAPKVARGSGPETQSSPPWASTACILWALFALATTEASASRPAIDAAAGEALPIFFGVAPIFAAMFAILLSTATRSRVRAGSRAAYVLRGMLTLAAGVIAVLTVRDIQAFYYLPFLSRLFKLIFAFECVLQHWQQPVPGRPRGAVLVFLGAILFTLAARTYDPQFIKFLTPPFVVLLILSARGTRARESARMIPEWLGAAAVAFTLGTCAAATLAVHANELSRILNSFLRPSRYNDVSDANTRPMLGRSFNQPLSQKRVMRIEGLLQEHHMRGMAFEIYLANGAWGPVSEARTIEDPGPALKALPGGERLTVTPLIEGLEVLYVPLHMAGVDAKGYKLRWSREWDGPLYAVPTGDPCEPYQVTIRQENYSGPLVAAMNEAVRQRCLELPEDLDKGVAKIAATIGATLKNPVDAKEKMDAVRQYLWANHQYSLQIELPPGDKIANFLLNKKNGHCQFFASAAVVLLRCMNVPTRYVTGYYVHESPEEGVTIARQRDAHAWTEVWLEDEGWVTFDPTPPGGMPGQAGSVTAWSRFWDRIEDHAAKIGAWFREAAALKAALLIALLALAFVAARTVRRMRQKAAGNGPKVFYGGESRSLRELAKRFDAYLRRKGVPCPAQETWRGHLEGLRRKPEPADMAFDWDGAQGFVREYTLLRFGVEAPAERVDALRRALDKLK